MKNILFIIMLSAVAFSISAQSVGDELIGTWRVQPALIEQEDGLLVSPVAPYAYPYLGINEITFLDTGFVVFTAAGTEYRAFYEVESLDFDNLHIKCLFKDGEEFLVKLVREGDSFGILYRISSDSLLKGAAEKNTDEEMSADGEAPMQPEKMMTGAEGAGDEMPAEEAPESLYTGRLIKK